MLKNNIAYLVTVISGVDSKQALLYPAYGAFVDADDDGNEFVVWKDADRERLSKVAEVATDEEDQFIFKDPNGNIISFTKFTKKLFNQFKEDVFATDFVLNYKADDDDELQLFLMTLE